MFVVVLIGTFVVSLFGFCQIIGCVKYKRDKRGIGTIFLWLAILIGTTIIAHSALEDYIGGYYIGLGIGFLFSLGVKPDDKYNSVPPEAAPDNKGRWDSVHS